MSDGTVVNATHLDSVRIARADGTTLQIPAACVLAIDDVLRRLVALDAALSVEPRCEPDGPRAGDHAGWEAWVDTDPHGHSLTGATPWQAVMSLAEDIR